MKVDEPTTKYEEPLNLDKPPKDSEEKLKVCKIDDETGTENKCNAPKPAKSLYTECAAGQQFSQEIVRVLKQVVNLPKIEYIRFTGDPLKYVTFMHNFEICLERDNPDPDRRLQLLIQHSTGMDTKWRRRHLKRIS